MIGIEIEKSRRLSANLIALDISAIVSLDVAPKKKVFVNIKIANFK